MGLPSLSPLSDEPNLAGLPVQVPPPPSFRPLRGKPRQVNLNTMQAPYVQLRGDTAAKDAGLRYEAKIQSQLTTLFPTYLATPQLEFVDDGGWRLIRPDGVLTLSDRTVAIEVKLQHMPEAWWQLRKLYTPVLAAGTKRPCQVVEIVRSYDPAMPFPEEPKLLRSDVPPPLALAEWIFSNAALPLFGVLLWKV